MANSKNIAGLLGPAIVAITISETLNVHIWADNTAAGVIVETMPVLAVGIFLTFKASRREK